MPHPKTCFDFVAVEHHNSSDTISQRQFANMSIAAAMNNAIWVLKQTKRMEAMTPPGTEKRLWHSCVGDYADVIIHLNYTLDIPGHPLDPCNQDTEIGGAVSSINDCERGFKRMNITNVFPVTNKNLTYLVHNAWDMVDCVVG